MQANASRSLKERVGILHSRKNGSSIKKGSAIGDYPRIAYILIAFCVFSYPFYASSLLPMRLSLAMSIAGLCAVVLLFLTRGIINFSHTGWFASWFVVGLIAAASAGASGYSYDSTHVWYPLMFTLSVLIMLMCSRSADWILPTLQTIVVMLIPFALGTIVLYFIPDLFAQVKNVLFPDSYFATGYQSGLTTHYSYNGTYNIVGFLISIGLLLFSGKTGKHKRLWIAAMLIFAFALMLIGKRQNLVFGAFAVFVVYAASGNRGKTFKIALTLSVLLVALELAISYIPGVEASFDRLFDTFEADDVSESTSGRTFIWEAAIKGWESSPLFGHGWGVFTYQFSINNTVHAAHNELLNLLYEAGIVGAVATTLCVLFSLAATWIAFRGTNRSEALAACDLPYKAALGVSLLIQTYLVVTGYTIGSLFSSPSSFMPYFLAVAIAIACRWSLKRKEPPSKSLSGPASSGHRSANIKKRVAHRKMS
ncbi:O-antigen ligase family protein [Eggerthella guodeyinii]|uniref:O-antigen ligase-related domain-containing protein n=1 Tax=Eggerthella guodeyinii TaxID=2690837 RepID=A0A6N7RRY1_9ACTN|nr:O-antigen ligase family protein [Eggerthella guodeyinii]MRX84016.1 hypothetical protein [Eggerthella guodeyinii]